MATQSLPPAMPPSRIRCAIGVTITISTQASITCKAGIMTRRSGDLSTETIKFQVTTFTQRIYLHIAETTQLIVPTVLAIFGFLLY